MEAGFARLTHRSQPRRIAGLEDGNQDFFGGAGIGGALQNDQLARAQVWSDGARRLLDVAEVGLMIAVQRRGDADDDGVHLGDLGVGGGGAEASGMSLDDLAAGNARDVGVARVQRLDLAGIHVKAGDAETLLAEKQDQRQPNIPHANYTNASLPSGNTGFKFRGKCSRKQHENGLQSEIGNAV